MARQRKPYPSDLTEKEWALVQPLLPPENSIGSPRGCVALTGGGLVKVAFVLTALSHRHPVHEPQALLQVASLPIRHHLAVCTVVLALPKERYPTLD